MCIHNLFLSAAESHSIVWVDQGLSHLWIDVWFVSSSELADRTVRNVHVAVSVWTYAFISPGEVPRSGMAGSHVRGMFHFIRNCQAVLQSGYILKTYILHYIV